MVPFRCQKFRKKHLCTLSLEERSIPTTAESNTQHCSTPPLLLPSTSSVSSRMDAVKEQAQTTSRQVADKQITQQHVLDRTVSDTSTETSTRSGADAASCRLPQFNQHGNAVDGLYRSFAAPTSEVNVEEALKLPPQPKTFRHHLEKLRETGGEKITRVTTEEDKKAEFERVKNVLRSWGGQNTSS
jgi:hypothetical protein